MKTKISYERWKEAQEYERKFWEVAKIDSIKYLKKFKKMKDELKKFGGLKYLQPVATLFLFLPKNLSNMIKSCKFKILLNKSCKQKFKLSYFKNLRKIVQYIIEYQFLFICKKN